MQIIFLVLYKNVARKKKWLQNFVPPIHPGEWYLKSQTKQAYILWTGCTNSWILYSNMPFPSHPGEHAEKIHFKNLSILSTQILLCFCPIMSSCDAKVSGTLYIFKHSSFYGLCNMDLFEPLPYTLHPVTFDKLELLSHLHVQLPNLSVSSSLAVSIVSKFHNNSVIS